MEASPSTNTYTANSGVTMGIDALGLTEDNQAEAAGGTAPPSQQTTSYTQEANDSSVISHPLDSSYSKPCQNETPQSPRSPDLLSPKESRRVSFPLDATVVSGYMDPPNPWQEASSCTTEELIASYIAACKKHNVKPLPKLLNQLMAITNFCDRNETFTLKGEKLDAKHCETLEEVLRRVQFRTIDIENTHLDDESAVTLFDMVEYYESCTRLNISHNKGIGIRGWQSCARLVKKTPCIDCLDARNCNLTEQAMPMLGRALRMGSQLTTLHLENAILSGRPLMILVTAVKTNDILRELYLADNKLMPSDGIQLGNMLKYNHKLQLLDIRNNHLQDVGTSHLCDGLFEQNLGHGLNTLVLWNNQVTFQSMPSLARALVNTLNLETLNLGHNNITNEGVHRLKEGLLINKSLLRIGLQASKISCEGAVALAEFIADSPRLLRVDLRENDTKTGGLMALSLALKVSQTVTRIDLDKDPKRESGVKDYADQQRRLLQDVQNLILRNRDLARTREAEAEVQRQVDAETEAAQQAEAAAAAAAEAEQPEEETAEQRDEEVGSGSGRAVLRLPSLGPPARTMMLESPCFVSAAHLPVMSPPSEEQVASEIAAINAAVATADIPVEFPPSPMSPNKSIFTTLQDEASQKGTSPNARRKFIISKVVEEEVEAGPSATAATAAAAAVVACEAKQGYGDVTQSLITPPCPLATDPSPHPLTAVTATDQSLLPLATVTATYPSPLPLATVMDLSPHPVPTATATAVDPHPVGTATAADLSPPPVDTATVTATATDPSAHPVATLTATATDPSPHTVGTTTATATDPSPHPLATAPVPSTATDPSPRPLATATNPSSHPLATIADSSVHPLDIDIAISTTMTGATSLPVAMVVDPSEASAEIPEAACPQEQPATNGSTSSADPDSAPPTDDDPASCGDTQSTGASGTLSAEGAAPPTTEGEGCSSEVAPESIKVELPELQTVAPPPSVTKLNAPAANVAMPVPNFHSNLSLNGMKVELATVLDTLEKADMPAIAGGASLDEVLKAKAPAVEATD